MKSMWITWTMLLSLSVWISLAKFNIYHSTVVFIGVLVCLVTFFSFVCFHFNKFIRKSDNYLNFVLLTTLIVALFVLGLIYESV